MHTNHTNHTMHTMHTTEISYIDGIKQDSKGDYYITLTRDSRGNIVETGKKYLAYNSDNDTGSVMRFDSASISSHEFIIYTKKRTVVKTCGRSDCLVCGTLTDFAVIDTEHTWNYLARVAANKAFPQ